MTDHLTQGEALKQLQDYFESDEYKRNHILRALQDIADRLNQLDGMGYEPMEADFTSCPASSIPFGPTGVPGLPLLGPFVVYWKAGEAVTTGQWVVSDSLSDQA